LGVDSVDCLVIGAGVLGLAVARARARAGREVIVVESEGAIGSGISSRDAEWHGAMIALETPVIGGEVDQRGLIIETGG
jgi:NADPH-dependent 2,4-dienoyl-CoA reductase/sulfur reductase-like enzyme